MAATSWQELRELMRRQRSLKTTVNVVDEMHLWEKYKWSALVGDRPPEPPTDEPDKTQAALSRALDRLSKLEVAVAPVIAVFREYLADSFLPDDARVLIDELPLAGLCHGDLRALMAVWDATPDEGAAA